MMNPTLVAVLMLAIVVGCILWNKIPMNFVMFVVPFVCCLALGFSVQETSESDQFGDGFGRLYAAVWPGVLYHADRDRYV